MNPQTPSGLGQTDGTEKNVPAVALNSADDPYGTGADNVDKKTVSVAGYKYMQSQYPPPAYSPAEPKPNVGGDAVLPTTDDIMTSLCKCGGPCVEACFCYWCQVSRQYNIILNEEKGLHWGVCCALAWLDICVLSAISMGCQCFLRGRLRRRYNLKEACCCDCCTVLCCACCALSQTHWELAMRGDDPGATCSCSEADVTTVMR